MGFRPRGPRAIEQEGKLDSVVIWQSRLGTEGADAPGFRSAIRTEKSPSTSASLSLLSNTSSEGVAAGHSAAQRRLQETGGSTR